MMAIQSLFRKFCYSIRGTRAVQSSRKATRRVKPVSELACAQILPGEPPSRDREPENAARARDARHSIIPRAQVMAHVPDPEEYMNLEEVDAMAEYDILPSWDTLMYIPDLEEYVDPEEVDVLRGRFDDGAIGPPSSSEDEVDD
eukprot:TRINITY_DN64728_c0_g1_i1.p1 TRINITY_DN64728_c0_g1~~TRINITY_DN64728_c0_g1_i1.p1  ORF type:complete len:164 (-),score=28.07 TRINITY_DN64728_c0_g1_i1:403-834(-)